MSTNPIASFGSGGNDSISSVFQILKLAKGANDLLGRRGALRTGDWSKGIGAANDLYGGYQGISGQKPTTSGPGAPSARVPTNAEPTTQTTFGMSQEEFMRLDPQLRERMLQQLMGR